MVVDLERVSRFLFVEIVHIKLKMTLEGFLGTCLTKDVSLLCLKYKGRTCFENSGGFFITSEVPSSLQETMSWNFSSYLILFTNSQSLPRACRRFS